MTLIRRLSILMICLAMLTLAGGYAAAGYWGMLPVFAFLGGLWLGLLPLNQNWIHSIALILFIGMAAFGVLAFVPAGWMLVCLAAALSAWDLEYFLHRLKSVDREETSRLLAYQHLRRLSIVIGLGVILAGASMVVQTQFSLGVALLVGLLAILALSQVIGFLGRESD